MELKVLEVGKKTLTLLNLAFGGMLFEHFTTGQFLKKVSIE